MKTFLTVLLAGCFFFTGCVSHAMKSFVGHSSAELAASWGSPTERIPDGSGGEVWVYSQQRTVTTPGQVNTTASAYGNTTGTIYPSPPGFGYQENSYARGQATTTYTPPQNDSYTAVRSFFVSRDGIVTGYRWKGL